MLPPLSGWWSPGGPFRNHLGAIYGKLGVSGRQELAEVLGVPPTSSPG